MKKLFLNKEMIAQLGNQGMNQIMTGNGTETSEQPEGDTMDPCTYCCTGNYKNDWTSPYDPRATWCDQHCCPDDTLYFTLRYC